MNATELAALAAAAGSPLVPVQFQAGVPVAGTPANASLGFVKHVKPDGSAILTVIHFDGTVTTANVGPGQ